MNHTQKLDFNKTFKFGKEKVAKKTSCTDKIKRTLMFEKPNYKLKTITNAKMKISNQNGK